MVSTGTAINLDLRNGVTDRFRSLPISRTAPLLGSVPADVLRYLIAVVILFAIGTLLGFRVQGGASAALGAAGLAILFGFCLSRLTVLNGVLVRSAAAVTAFSFIAFLPLQLGSSLAGPTDNRPAWLRALGRHQPRHPRHGRLPRPAERDPRGRQRRPHPALVGRPVRRLLPARRPRLRGRQG
ncbi:ABC transporter permease [Streptomyces sp. CA-250714]|uniref:ABC transporter permease n=1 Tax=Streptomyces sp. CA-250714 TaxID=3240060 RepID=UPI003D8B6579